MAATKGDQARVRGGDFEELVWCRGRAVQPAEELGTDQNYFILYLLYLGEDRALSRYKGQNGIVQSEALDRNLAARGWDTG